MVEYTKIADRIVYQLSVEDLLTVISEENLDIDLSEKDIEYLENKISENIDWYSAIKDALSLLSDKKNNPSPNSE